MWTNRTPSLKDRRPARGQHWIALAVALLANALLFCVLARARTEPSWRNPPATARIPVALIERPSSPDTERAIQQAERDDLPLRVAETSPPMAAATPTAAAAMTPLPARLNVGTSDLPGIALALPEASDLRSLPGAPISSIAGPLSLATVDRVPRRTAGTLPRYPQWARQARLEAMVTLRFVVTPDGKVTNINIHRLKGDERLGREAMRTVAAWHFDPATKQGKPVACWCFQKVSFRLDD